MILTLEAEVLGEKHCTSMEHWWNDTDRGKVNYWEKNIIQRWWEIDE